MEQKKFKIWSSILDEKTIEDWIEEINVMREEDNGNDFCGATAEDVYEENEFCLEAEKTNLNRLVAGVIVCFANLGLWNGRKNGMAVVGSNLNQVLSFGTKDALDSEFFCDQYNCRSDIHHHDGTNHYLFRYTSRDKAKRLMKDFQNGLIKDEKDFMRRTTSIRPYISEIYGWKNYGKIVKAI